MCNPELVWSMAFILAYILAMGAVICTLVLKHSFGVFELITCPSFVFHTNKLQGVSLYDLYEAQLLLIFSFGTVIAQSV
jgi:hypothetical protein